MNDRMNTGHDDPESAVLGETWAAFGQILSAVELPLDEAKLVERVCERLNRRRRIKRRLVASFAMSAALLMAVTLASRDRPPKARTVAAAYDPDFSWHDELDAEIVLTKSDLDWAEAELHTSMEPAHWLQEEVDVLQSDIESSPL